MQTIRPYGRNRIAVHLPAEHPALDTLKEQSLFVTSYSKAGEIIAYDLAFLASKRLKLEEILSKFVG